MKHETVDILKQAVKNQIIAGKSIQTFTLPDLDDANVLEHDGNIAMYITRGSGEKEYQLTKAGFAKIMDELGTI